jgi:hypothetical protein
VKYKVFKVSHKGWRNLFNKKYYWVVYDEIAGPYMAGWNWTEAGAHNDADLYMMKVDDGRYFR